MRARFLIVTKGVASKGRKISRMNLAVLAWTQRCQYELTVLHFINTNSYGIVDVCICMVSMCKYISSFCPLGRPQSSDTPGVTIIPNAQILDSAVFQ